MKTIRSPFVQRILPDLHLVIASVLILSALGVNAPCMASQGSAAPQSLTPDVIKAFASNAMASCIIGSTKEAACVITPDHTAVEFILPNNPKTTAEVIKRNDSWLLTTSCSLGKRHFDHAMSSGVDSEGHQKFMLLDSNGNPVEVVKAYISDDGIQYVAWE